LYTSNETVANKTAHLAPDVQNTRDMQEWNTTI